MSDELRQQELVYVYSELGVTGDGKRLLYLYSSHERMDWVAAYVYEEDFELLPPQIKVLADQMGVNEDIKGPTKSEATSRKKLLEFSPPFVAMVGKGKKIDWSASSAGQASRPTVGGGPGLPGEAYVWEPMSAEQAERAKQLAGDIAQQQLIILDEVLVELDKRTGENERHPEMYVSLAESVHRSATYQFSKEWPSVRDALVKPASDVFGGTIDPLVIAVEEADEEDFLSAIAQHPLVVDEEFAKVLLKTVGETGIKKSVEDRVVQAKKVFLYIELASRHGLEKATAVAIVGQVHDEIPF